MTGNNLPADDHVVRYVKPTSVRSDGKPAGSAFCPRPDDTGLSVNWIECFRDCSKEQQIAEVRRLFRLKMRVRGRLAELNVGQTRRHLRDELDSLRFVHRPLVAEGPYEADPSHSEITGLPGADSPEAELIGDMIAESISAVYPAVQSQPDFR